MITNWRKATYSEPLQSCVEFGDDGDVYAVRDSKNEQGPVLVFSRRARAAFVAGLRRDAVVSSAQ